MFTFPLYLLLIPFGVIFLISFLFFFFNLFHINRYAIKSASTSLLVLLYIGGFGLITVGVCMYLLTVDWTRQYEAADLLPDFNNSRLID